MNIFNIAKTFELQSEKGWPEVYFCIDLHGTIIPSGKHSEDVTDELEMYPYAKEVLQRLTINKNIKLILWSSTPNHRLPRITEFFREHGIVFDYFNSNPDAKDTPRADFRNKFYFNVLLDDRSGFEPLSDWKLVKEELIRINKW